MISQATFHSPYLIISIIVQDKEKPLDISPQFHHYPSYQTDLEQGCMDYQDGQLSRVGNRFIVAHHFKDLS